MNITNKVLTLPHICGIEIDTSSNIAPTIASSLQPFYNTYVQDSTAQPAYFTPSKVSLREKSKQSTSGMVYTHQVKLQFPNSDPLRVNRIQEYLQVKYIYLKLSNGLVLFFGRNDFFQNAAPKVSTSSTEKITTITYTTTSMFPLGFTNGSFDFNLNESFPINFYNL